MTKAAYARYRECDEKAVRKAIVEGRITIGDDGLLDPAVADVEWAQNTRARADSGSKGAPGAAAGTAPPDQPSLAPPGPDAPSTAPPSAPIADGYAESRARRERAEAEMAELNVAKLAGRLVDRERVEAAVFDAFRVLRDRVMAVPRRAAPSVVGLVEVREVELQIADELRRALGIEGEDADLPVSRLTEKVLNP